MQVLADEFKRNRDIKFFKVYYSYILLVQSFFKSATSKIFTIDKDI